MNTDFYVTNSVEIVTESVINAATLQLQFQIFILLLWGAVR